ncbi:glutamine synthetase adenylyltransferase [Streptomyces sp. L-9-10]|uniref:DUF4255 domain-containing protein n=1 Tax=Streptomyces sp. L-9-10 TaxID=1478131 RepID=UPI00101C0A60|nr:DUF4255 domain-containing protein [Streptomyces sp. L-9-10]RYJ30224.1 glutamine synthetase adenylyltransferase [Streptomyces sp. L-9-10]
MSNALAVATVTQALALLIESNLGPEIDIAVKVETRKPPAEPPAEPTINVFLYQVTPNASMRHTDLPTRASDGTLIKRPAAPLDLHYLISAYGEEAELVSQRLIGCVVRTLHEIPVLSQELIELAAERPYLAGSDLAASAQRVRFTPTVMDIDETSKLWGMLHHTPYTLSVAYQASLVLIEGRERPVPAKPVERRTVRALPFGAPGAPVPPVAGDPSGAGAPSVAGAPSDADGTATEGATAEKETGTKPESETKPKAGAPAKKRAASRTATAKTPAKRAASASRTRTHTRGKPGAGDDGTES